VFELQEPYKKKSRSSAALEIVIANVGGIVTQHSGLFPHWIGYALGFALVTLFVYWIPPKPPVTFHLWSLKVIFLALYLVYGLWFLPHWISKWIWTPLAYGVPTCILVTFLYWMLPLYPVQKKTSIGWWIFVSFVIAVWYGTYMYVRGDLAG
jgi:hypothetical protein